MHTPFGLTLALASCFAAPSSSENPTWHQDYSEARKLGQEEKKPLAVLVGSGQAGYADLCKHGEISDAVRKLLAKHYVCVYADVTTAHGQKLAKALAITSGKGVVLSNRTGDLQAFFHDGDLSAADLTRAIEHFADAKVVVKTTATNTYAATGYAPQPTYASGATYGYVPGPQYGPPMGYTPGPIGGGFGGFGGFGGGGRGC
jgi:hypothetical protein